MIIPDRRTREVQAESVAYTVCQHYGLDTSDYSFGYVVTWSSGRELAELKNSLETIRAAAAEIIDSIDERFAELKKMREIYHDSKDLFSERPYQEEKVTGQVQEREGKVSNTVTQRRSVLESLHTKQNQVKAKYDRKADMLSGSQSIEESDRRNQR